MKTNKQIFYMILNMYADFLSLSFFFLPEFDLKWETFSKEKK